ncbi:MAG: hypothetical protein PF488_00950 [Patescibacteria group bacterium]|nr:hypothetical protein [Patescibacteria group bacterium]
MPKLYGQLIINVPVIQKWTGFTRASAQNVINRFIDIGIENLAKYSVFYICRLIKIRDIKISNGHINYKWADFKEIEKIS